jgi:uncharacterized protein DUF222/HNH endonuclease
MDTYPSDVPIIRQPTPARIAELERLGDEIAELSAHLEAATAGLLALIREFDAREGWANGFRSCAEWLAWRVGLAPGAAREHVRVARALGTLPALAEAMARGELSYAKVRALTRIATPETEARLLAVGRAGTAVHVESIVRGWRRLGKPTRARPPASRRVGRCTSTRTRTAPWCSVDAWVLANAAQPGQSVLEDGPHVPAGTSQRLACDASRVVMRHDADGRVVEVGARTRTIPPASRRALQHRDKTCRFPGCTVRIAEGHHVRHWAHGGPTKLSNLALLCRRHHPAVHEEGYQVERRPDGALQFRRPDGRPLPDVPAPAAVPADPAGTLRAQNAAQGLTLNARTGVSQWYGERLDVRWAIDVLHPWAAAKRRDA